MPPLPPISKRTRFARGEAAHAGKTYPFGGRLEDEDITPSERMIGRLTLAVMIWIIARSLNLI